jgi:endonuclease YncB( thermonuclease family)
MSTAEASAPEPPQDAPKAAAGEPPKPPGSDLPNVDVAPRTVHTVPDAEPPAASVTIVDRNGRTLKEINPSAGLSPTYVPSVGPGGAASAARGSTRLPPPPLPNSRLASLPPGTTSFDGKGNALGGTMLSVSGRDIRLFGVRLPEGRDKCGLGPGDNRSCNEVARDALAQRLQRYPNVACRVPPGQRGDQVAICTDSSGTDLGSFLVAEGYALADTNQSFDYFGAEGAARANRRGLWRYR